MFDDREEMMRRRPMMPQAAERAQGMELRQPPMGGGQGMPQGGPPQRPDWGALMQRFQQRHQMPQPAPQQAQGAPPMGGGGMPQHGGGWLQEAIRGAAQRFGQQRQQGMPQRQPGGIVPQGWGRGQGY